MGLLWSARTAILNSSQKFVLMMKTPTDAHCVFMRFGLWIDWIAMLIRQLYIRSAINLVFIRFQIPTKRQNCRKDSQFFLIISELTLNPDPVVKHADTQIRYLPCMKLAQIVGGTLEKNREKSRWIWTSISEGKNESLRKIPSERMLRHNYKQRRLVTSNVHWPMSRWATLEIALQTFGYFTVRRSWETQKELGKHVTFQWTEWLYLSHIFTNTITDIWNILFREL